MVRQDNSSPPYHYRLLCYLLIRLGLSLQQQKQLVQNKRQKEVELHVASSMRDPLQLERMEDQHEEDIPEDPCSSKSIVHSSVRCWSTSDVSSWFQHLPLDEDRKEELLHTLQKEGTDGSKLLVLQRDSQVCLGMTEPEWLTFEAARESLLQCNREGGMLLESQTSSRCVSPLRGSFEEHSENESVSFTESSTRLETSKSLTLGTSSNSGFLASYLKFLSLPRHLWSSSSNKYEQDESIKTEVYSLQEEVLSAEEREAALKAKMAYLDEILRTARLASYLYTRIRWTPLPGELPVDDSDVDDWLQRFLVLEGSTLFFYPRAADFRPQGAILLKEVVDIGEISGEIHHEQENVKWFGFHITTADGLRLECATPLKLQAELWMSLLQDAYAEQHTQVT